LFEFIHFSVGGLTVYFKIVLKPVVEVQDIQAEVVQKTLVKAVENNQFTGFKVDKETIAVEGMYSICKFGIWM
jgi:hypothetical protein